MQTYFEFETCSITPQDFPELFQCLDPPPSLLRVRGKRGAAALLLANLPRLGLGIVGTRHPTPVATQHLRHMIQGLSHPWVIVSGLAVGIDGQAHAFACDAGLPCVAVLGGGLDRFFPGSNLPLAQRILESGGLVLSEYPDDVCPAPHTFLERNRIIAGISKALWVVQARSRSGALNTAAWSRKWDRNVYVTPSFPGDSQFGGNERLLSSGLALPLWNPHDLDLESQSF